MRVLVADDETMLRRLLVMLLSRETDMELVGEAENGREAVDMALRLKPDVVLMDLNMPQLNGLQAMERIAGQAPQIRVVILTGMGELNSLGKTLGASEWLDKKQAPEDLLRAIRRAVTTPEPAGPREGALAGYGALVDRLALRADLTDRERAVVRKAVMTELTMNQIAHSLTIETGRKVTYSSVKHALERAMAKLRIEPRTRSALIKRIVESEDRR
jgi:DNA-binding NarL/FixJ family response regulator